MNNTEKFLFDLQGFLKVPNFLTGEEVKTLNGAFDANEDKRTEDGRRSLLYRYSPKYLHFAGGSYETSQPAWVAELTEAQQAVLEPPYIYNRPLIEEDGVTVVRPTVG